MDHRPRLWPLLRLAPWHATTLLLSSQPPADDPQDATAPQSRPSDEDVEPAEGADADGLPSSASPNDDSPIGDLPIGDLPIGDLPIGDLPIGDLPIGDAPPHDSLDRQEAAPFEQDEVDLPVFGRLRASRIGLPAFTIAIGLVDGFNPCAMWVLLFLLSILVNLRDRRRILLVAGTFVVISGLAYFVFMAAWLNVFMMVGLVRPIQIGLGLMALAVGAIHMKDFFAFKKGVSLSIPESAKPGIYRRVRAIVTAEHLKGALAGAIVLAVLVNIVELLCTAGLPALYTQVLTLQQLPAWKNYAYLSLYISAYMFDDALMVTVVTVTLGKHKMQQTEGEWLKLVSGFVIFALGIVMLFRPELLH